MPGRRFPGKLACKAGMLRNSYYLLFVTGTDIDHTTVFAICLYGKTLCCPENGLGGIVI